MGKDFLSQQGRSLPAFPDIASTRNAFAGPKDQPRCGKNAEREKERPIMNSDVISRQRVITSRLQAEKARIARSYWKSAIRNCRCEFVIAEINLIPSSVSTSLQINRPVTRRVATRRAERFFFHQGFLQRGKEEILFLILTQRAEDERIFREGSREFAMSNTSSISIGRER